MLTFIVYTVFFLVAGNCLFSIFMRMIQPGGALDEVFGWQSMLARFYRSDKKAVRLLEKALGGCKECAAFWFMPGWFVLYYLFCRHVLHFFPTDVVHPVWAKVLIFIAWNSAFWGIGAAGGLTLVTLLGSFKMKKRAKNGL